MAYFHAKAETSKLKNMAGVSAAERAHIDALRPIAQRADHIRGKMGSAATAILGVSALALAVNPTEFGGTVDQVAFGGGLTGVAVLAARGKTAQIANLSHTTKWATEYAQILAKAVR
jgi:hypothetical protein